MATCCFLVNIFFILPQFVLQEQNFGSTIKNLIVHSISGYCLYLKAIFKDNVQQHTKQATDVA